MTRVGFLLALVISTALAGAQDALTANEIVAKAENALGGRENLAQIKTRVANGNVQVLGGFPGKFQEWAKAPNKLKTTWDIGYIGQVRAFDGKTGWEKNASVRELVGADLEHAKRAAVFDSLSTLMQQNAVATLKGKESIPENELPFVPSAQLETSTNKLVILHAQQKPPGQRVHETYVIELTPPVQEPVTFYFDSSTFLPLREAYNKQYEEGVRPVVISYADYRKVQNVMLPFAITRAVPDLPLSINISEYRLNEPIADNVFESPVATHVHDRYEIALETIPRHVYKENDGIWVEGWTRFWGIPFSPTESWLFNVVVNERYGRYLEPVSASLEFYSGNHLVKVLNYTQDALKELQKFPTTRFAPQPEIYDFRYYGSEPTTTGIDRILYKLKVQSSDGTVIDASKEIPLTHYQQKAKLIFPIKGYAMVVDGHEFYELGHKYEWSQHYGYDIIGLGPDFDLARNNGATNEDFVAFGKREILSPADGTVVYARQNDVPDDMPSADYLSKLPEPIMAIGGNLIIIDHGNGEYSLLAHNRQGSVLVKAGDRVKQGQVIALMGAAGAPGAPHVHYQLQSSPGLFDGDGLPSQFENVFWVGWAGRGEPIRTPKRGLYIEAR